MKSHLLLIDSQNRLDSPLNPTGTFTWKLGLPLRHVSSVELVWATVPNVALTLPPGSSVQFAYDGGAVAAVALTPGNYTAAGLAAELSTQLSTASGVAFTVAVTDEFTFAFSHAGGGGQQFSLRVDDAGLARRLGLVAGNTHASANGGAAPLPLPAATPFDLASPAFYGVQCDALATDGAVDTGTRRLVFAFPNTGGAGEIVTYAAGSAAATQRLEYPHSALPLLAQLTLSLVDAATGSPVDLRGAHWSLLLRVTAC